MSRVHPVQVLTLNSNGGKVRADRKEPTVAGKINHPSGEGPIGMSRALLGGRPTRTLGAVGGDMKVHMVRWTDLVEWKNPHGALFTKWSASCGRSGTVSGWLSTGTASGLNSLDTAVRGMLCSECCSGV